MPRLKRRSRRRRVLVWSLVAVGAIIVLFGLAALTANLIVTRSAAGFIVRDPANAPSAQAAIVLGAHVYSDGTPSNMLADRLGVGIKLYELGKVKKLLLSGDHGTTTYDEVNAMLTYVVARGVPTEDVFTDHAGFDTYDTMYRAVKVFQVKSALVVTQDFHLSRAVYTARTLGLDAHGVSADQSRATAGPRAAEELRSLRASGREGIRRAFGRRFRPAAPPALRNRPSRCRRS